MEIITPWGQSGANLSLPYTTHRSGWLAFPASDPPIQSSGRAIEIPPPSRLLRPTVEESQEPVVWQANGVSAQHHFERPQRCRALLGTNVG
ncbi:MAG: hypothetical protein Q9228_003453 [Teloschistes exilis]